MDPRFSDLLDPDFLLQLERSPSSAFGLWGDGRVAYINPGWVAFAAENGGQPAVLKHWGVGARYLDAISVPLRPFYEDLLRDAPARTDSLHPTGHVYECSTPDLFRRFRMQVYTLPERSGFVVVNALLIEEPMSTMGRDAQDPVDSLYITAKGFIVQCPHCRRVKRAAGGEDWSWIPAWVRTRPARTTHALCAPCSAYYYPKA